MIPVDIAYGAVRGRLGAEVFPFQMRQIREGVSPPPRDAPQQIPPLLTILFSYSRGALPPQGHPSPPAQNSSSSLLSSPLPRSLTPPSPPPPRPDPATQAPEPHPPQEASDVHQTLETDGNFFFTPEYTVLCFNEAPARILAFVNGNLC